MSGLRGGAGAVAAGLARRAGRRRRRWVLGAAAVAAAGVLLLTVGAAAELPLVVADAAVGWLFGGRSDATGQPLPQVCSPVPAVRPVAGDGGGGVVAGVDAAGRATSEALRVIDAIPVGAPVDTAQGWVLYRLAHPGDIDGRGRDFAAFAADYSAVAATLNRQANALDVVSTLDHTADYSPFLLLAQAASYQLIRQGSVAFTDEQRADVVEQLNISCAPRDDGAR